MSNKNPRGSGKPQPAQLALFAAHSTPGHSWAAHSWLREPWHDYAVGGAEIGHRRGDRRITPASPQKRFSATPALLRGQRTGKAWLLSGDGQLRCAQKADGLGLFPRHPRFHFHSTPTSASGINQVQRRFALLTDKTSTSSAIRTSRPGNWRRPSRNGWKFPMPTLSRSYGTSPQTTASPAMRDLVR